VDQSTPTFLVQRGKDADDQELFRLTLTRSGNNRDQSRKLSKSLRILAKMFGSGPSKNCTHVITPASWHVVWKSFLMILPLARKLLTLKAEF